MVNDQRSLIFTEDIGRSLPGGDPRRASEKYCRVFAFDVNGFATAVGPDAGALEVPHLSLYAVRAAARDNDRAAPHQSAFLLSNVVEIESYIAHAERDTRKRFLTKIDLPLAEARPALDELRFMGLTEASLFLGVDGLCHELRDRFFR